MKTSAEVLNEVGYPGFVRSLFNRSGDPSKDFAHAVLGIVTECHEYVTATDAVNALEESGDLEFYLEALTQVLDDHTPIQYDAIDAFYVAAQSRIEAQGVWRFNDVSTEWLDLAKRWIGYGKAPTMCGAQLIAEAQLMIEIVRNSGRAANTPKNLVRTSNVDKLIKRYNGIVFSAEAAVNRDTAAERGVLEASAASAG